MENIDIKIMPYKCKCFYFPVSEKGTDWINNQNIELYKGGILDKTLNLTDKLITSGLTFKYEI